MDWLLYLVVGVALMWMGVVFWGPPYVPTLQRELERLFQELVVTKRDSVVDLGAGDGRVLKTAARFGANVAGVEMNPFLVGIARWRLRKVRDAHLTLGDMWHYKLPAKTTHVFIFPVGAVMNKLEQYLDVEAARVGGFTLVVYAFTLKKKQPVRTIGPFNLYTF